MSDQPQPLPYQAGQIVNGYVWTGTYWLPVQEEPPSSSSSLFAWRILGAVVAFLVAALAGLQGLSWIMAFVELDSEGNDFAGMLALLGMAALAVAAAFALAGIFLIKK